MRGQFTGDDAAMGFSVHALAPAVQRNIGPLVGSRPSKRFVDLLILAVALPMVLPLAVLIALAICLDSRGPILYSQARIGFRGRHFRMWKFRTMVENADETLAVHLAQDPAALAEWRATQKLKLDPRITRLGRWLRRSSLDELPQLWNVLVGEMSLVGPRPIIPGEQARYGAAYHYYLQTRPGLTGLWQVSGRNDLSYAKRVELDAHYVQTWNLTLDGAIVFKTIGVVVRGDGAY